MVATWFRTVLTIGTRAVSAHFDHVTDTLQASHPRVAEIPVGSGPT